MESVCVAFSRLVEAFATDPDKLQAIASHGLLLNLQQLVCVKYISAEALLIIGRFYHGWEFFS